jgi:hypothetical protein
MVEADRSLSTSGFLVSVHERRRMSESTMEKLPIGTRVIDTEDDDPSVGIVVWRSPEQTIADWEFQTSEGPMTTAETNPEYPADTQLVVVAFETDLDASWEGWRDANPDTFFEGVRKHGVRRYGFPEPRLAPADENRRKNGEREVISDEEAEMPPEEFTPIMERLEQNEFAVGYDSSEQVLRVEKYGIEHTIAHDGTVQGESGIKGRVETIVQRFL